MSGQLEAHEEKILVVDDTSENIKFLGKVLQSEGYLISFATDGPQALSIAPHGCDLILLDIMMPGMSGFEVCRKLKELPETKDIPVIFLTAINQKEDIVKGLNLGAVDYITKPFQTEELLLRVRTHLELSRTRKQLISYLDDLGKENMVLEEVSITDGLTRLYNHSYIMERAVQEIANAKRHGSDISMIMFDLDFFKDVNDMYGHQVGDQVLVKVAHALKSRLREGDTAGRYGGEEFVVLLPNTAMEQAERIGERIRRFIDNLEWDIDGLHVTISGGVYERNDENAEDFVREADRLLYLAKQKGRNCLMCASGRTRTGS
ncbi:MAG: diguanylate cyclase [Spirochaetales bacterium]|nr:diguanylate cyclase [Spirochaetales bacterium]